MSLTIGQKLALAVAGAAGLYFATKPATASAAAPPAGGASGGYTPTGYTPTGYTPTGYTPDPYPPTFTPAGGSSGDTYNVTVPSAATASATRWASPVRGNAATWRLQNQLADMGYDPGPIDGRVGPLTRRAAEDFARTYGTTVPAMLTGTFAARVQSVWQELGGSEPSVSSGGGTQLAKGPAAGATDTYTQPVYNASDAGSMLYEPAYDALNAKGLSGFEDVRGALAGTGRYARRY